MSVIDVLARKDYADAAKATNDELIALSEQKGALFWKVHGELLRGSLLAQAGNASEAVKAISSSLTTIRSTGTKMFLPCFLMLLSEVHADLGEFDDAWGCINEALTAIQTNKERWCEAEVNRVAGEIALGSREPNAAKAETYFERALAVARQQQAKSWELRTAMSFARLWRDQGKAREARELLASVYGWFTEGFDTRDLKEAKALLDQLAA
jgi:predicted ATPase